MDNSDIWALNSISDILSNAEHRPLKDTQWELKQHLDLLNELYKELNEDTEFVDLRSGVETYGYKSEDDIVANMEYISDRWQAAFRIKWLIDFIDLPQEELERLTNHDWN